MSKKEIHFDEIVEIFENKIKSIQSSLINIDHSLKKEKYTSKLLPMFIGKYEEKCFNFFILQQKFDQHDFESKLLLEQIASFCHFDTKILQNNIHLIEQKFSDLASIEKEIKKFQ